MIKNINDFIKPVIKNGQLIFHKETDLSLEVKNFRCSTFISKENILVRGENNNMDETRGALILFFDFETGKILGWLNMPLGLV